MATDEHLRAGRLVFYSDTVNQIDALLKEFLRLSKSKSAYFIDRDGHLVTQMGETSGVNPEALAALVAGSFSATRELARVLGEPEFHSMAHKGDNCQIQIALVGKRSMIAIVFDGSTTAGMVALYCKELSDKVAKILDIAERQQAMHHKEEEVVDESYTTSLQEKLDRLFED
ncbi:MAG: roadblock/LC7 domain-containing protein [Nitrospinae bacterium]|nr:roadblock/LC7 domain-containing protein [Nitrospinota bacterium]